MTNPHPNATTSAGSTTAAVIIAWLAGHYGIDMGAETAIVVAGALTAVVLFIGRKGIVGVWAGIKNGFGK